MRFFLLVFALFPDDGSHYDPTFTGVVTAVTAVVVALLWGPQSLNRFRFGRKSTLSR